MTNKTIIGIVIIVVLIISIMFVSGVVFTGGNIIPTADPSTQKFTYECSVDVKEDLVGKGVSIESVACENTGKKCGGFFGIFSAEGVVEMWDSNGKLSSKQFETGLFSGTDDVTLKGCSAETEFTLRLYDDDHNLIDERGG